MSKWIIWKHRNETKHNDSRKMNKYQITRNILLSIRKYINLLLASQKRNQIADECITMLELCQNLYIV